MGVRLARRGVDPRALDALKARRAALQRQLRERRPQRDRRWWWLVLLLLLLLLLLWLRGCESPPAPEAPPAEAARGGGPGAAPPPPAPEPAPPEPMRARPRPDFVAEPAPAVPWIPALRLQVAARAPRLGACFVGAEAPGALRWTATMDASRGTPSDAHVEPAAGDALTVEQRDCVLAVLADPAYRLDPGGPSTPTRVSMVVEF